jgi:hypothetical protein
MSRRKTSLQANTLSHETLAMFMELQEEQLVLDKRKTVV